MQPLRLIHSTPAPAKILVVDDEQSICLFLARLLEPLGYTVEIALSANAAMIAMKRSAADVALCDIRMPGHDGVWLIEQLQAKYPHTAIVIATGVHDLDPRLTLRPGIVGYLVKPFEVEQVQDAVEEAVVAVRTLSPSPRLRLVPPPDTNNDLVGIRSMDIRRMERLVRDVIASEALPFGVVALNEGEHQQVEIIVSAGDGRTITITATSTATPAALRQFVRQRLEGEI